MIEADLLGFVYSCSIHTAHMTGLMQMQGHEGKLVTVLDAKAHRTPVLHQNAHECSIDTC